MLAPTVGEGHAGLEEEACEGTPFNSRVGNEEGPGNNRYKLARLDGRVWLTLANNF